MHAILRHTSRSGRGFSFDLYEFPGGEPAKLNDAKTNAELGLSTSRAYPGAIFINAGDKDTAAQVACEAYGVLPFEGWLS